MRIIIQLPEFSMYRCLTLLSVVALCGAGATAQLVDVGTRLELFVDDYLVERISGGAEQQLHRPQPREVVLVTDKPWEGNTSAYYTVFQDGSLYRMYYRGSHYDEAKRKAAHREVTCYAESKDGIHWRKPELGLYEFGGSKKNNIVWDGIGTHCFAAFKDANPRCQPDARYKAISRGRPRGTKGLYVFKSPDAIHWAPISSQPVITQGAFDSQNVAFWDPHAKVYREYHRTFHNGLRAIMTGSSRDFVHWTKPRLLQYASNRNEQLYTNAVRPYPRAPHLLIGFPTRFLPNEGQRVEPIFMSSRDGLHFRRWAAAVIPKSAPQDRGGNRSNYMTWGLLELPGHDNEYSVYATEAYYTGPDSRVRRFTYRVDGFVSLHAGTQPGEVLTKPLRFSGQVLTVNFATAATGRLQVELQHADGKPISGFTLADCQPLRGDAPRSVVSWKGGPKIAKLAGKPIRLRFRLADADLYAMRFENAERLANRSGKKR